jgi:flagellar hook-associated protein 2
MYIPGPSSSQAANTEQKSRNDGTSANTTARLDSTFTQLLVAQLRSQNPLSPMDPTTFVSQVLDAQRGQEALWKAQQATVQKQTSALNQIATEIASLYSDANHLRDYSGVMGTKSASSSQPGILLATANSTADTASHILQVQNLATTGASYSSVVDGSVTLTPGSLQITVGSNTQSVDIGTTNTSLDEIAAAVNQLNMGVTSKVQTDSTGSRLTLVSASSGSKAAVSVTGGTSQLSFTNLAGKDAIVHIDGAPFQSSTNTISGAIAGVTLNLASASPNADVTLKVSPDVSSVAAALNKFVTDFNSVVTSINSQFTYSAVTNSSGVLAGDSSLQAVQQALLSLTSFSMSGNGSLDSLRAMGIEMQDDGTLIINSSALNDTLTNNFPALANFFQGGAESFGAALGKSMTALNSPITGSSARS